MVLENVSILWPRPNYPHYSRLVWCMILQRLKANLSKAQYAATFLFIASVCFAKLSLVSFLRNLTPLPLDRKWGLIIGSLVVLWAITAALAFAFQCHLPQPWDYVNQACFNRVSDLPSPDSNQFWNFFEAGFMGELCGLNQHIDRHLLDYSSVGHCGTPSGGK